MVDETGLVSQSFTESALLEIEPWLIGSRGDKRDRHDHDRSGEQGFPHWHPPYIER